MCRFMCIYIYVQYTYIETYICMYSGIYMYTHSKHIALLIDHTAVLIKMRPVARHRSKYIYINVYVCEYFCVHK